MSVNSSSSDILAGRIELTDQALRPHFHEYWSFAAIQGGACDFLCDGSPIRTGRGGFTVIAPGAVHSGAAVRSGTLEYSFVCIPDNILNDAMEYEIDMSSISGIADYDYGLTRSILRTSNALLQCNQGLVDIDEELVLLAGEFSQAANGKIPQNKKEPTEQLRIAKEFLAGTSNLKQVVKQAARIADLHPNHFIRSFKSVYGITPHAYYQSCRIEDAKLLLATQKDLTEIGLSCGFYDQSHFIRVFRMYTGVTPMAYMNSLLKHH